MIPRPICKLFQLDRQKGVGKDDDLVGRRHIDQQRFIPGEVSLGENQRLGFIAVYTLAERI